MVSFSLVLKCSILHAKVSLHCDRFCCSLSIYLLIYIYEKHNAFKGSNALAVFWPQMYNFNLIMS